ncbi:MAG: CHAT domain-containing tetratricopeptide repeat protein [Candidatus Acidiferrales bacterium]
MSLRLQTSNIVRALGAAGTIFLLSPLVVGQQQSPQASNVPAELQAINPDVRAKLAAARADSDTGKYSEAFEEDQQALDVAKKAGFSGDIALAEDATASADFISGKVQTGWDLDRDALQNAIESSNLVLQADILTSLSSYSQIDGNVKGALSLLAQALDAAEKSKNLYIKSRVLGEMGRLQLLVGEKEDARKSLDEALRIDSLNSYRFHSLHLVYRAYLLLSDDQTVKQGVQELEEARDAAVSDRNYLALVLAETALGASYVHIGDVQQGIDILQSMNSGNVKIGTGAQGADPQLRAVLELPYIRASSLEALGKAYETAKRTSDAIAAWSQLYSFSGRGMAQANAEAAQHLGKLYAAQGDNENAAKYFQIAAAQWQTNGNSVLLIQSLSGEAVSLAKSGQSEKAISAENELAQTASRLKARRAEFLAYLGMAEIYQSATTKMSLTPTEFISYLANAETDQSASQLEQARAALEKAQALIEPGPDDPTLGNEAVTETYLRLSVAYEKLGDQEKQLAALEKALAVYIAVKDQPQINALVAALRQKFDAIHPEELISSLYKSNRFGDALIYAQLLQYFSGAPTGEKSSLFWQIIFNSPFQIVAQKGGSQQLEQDLQLMGPLLLPGEKLPILQALAQYHTMPFISGDNPKAGREYSLQAIALIDGSKPSLEALRLRSVCTLAVAYARTGSPILATQTVQSCMELEKKSTDGYEKKWANLANLFVHALENDIGGAQSSLEFLRQNAGDDPGRDEELAQVLGEGGHIADAMSEFTAAVRGYQNRNDLSSSARCYKEMASVLDSSTSPDSKKQELQFLNEAVGLYQRVGDAFQESGTDLAIAQYFAKLGNNRDAEHYFEQGLQSAERSGNQVAVGWAYLLLANSEAALQRREKAIPFYAKAAAAFNAAKDQRDEANALVAGGLDMQSMGRLDDALAAFLKAQTLDEESGQSLSQYQAQIQIGFVYEAKGQMELARAAFLKAVQISHDDQNLGNLARCDLDLSGLDSLQGDWQSALEHATEALNLFQQTGDRDGESDADEELGTIYSDRTSTVQDFGLARKYFATAQKLHYNKFTELDEIEIDIQTKHFVNAVANAKNVLAACRQGRSLPWDNGDPCAANALISLAEAERLSGDLKASAAALKQAKPLIAKIDDVYLRGRLLYGEANQERAAGHFQQSAALYQQTIQLIEAVKGNTDQESQLSLSDTYDFVYDEMVDCLYSLSEQEKGLERVETAIEALGYAETNKARQFEKSWGQSFVSELRKKLPLEVIQQEDTLRERRDELAAQLQARVSGTDGSAVTVADVQNQLANSEADLDNFGRALDRKYPDYAALEYPRPVTLDSIPLRNGETLAEFKMTDAATFVWIIRCDATKGNTLVSFYKVPEPRAWFLSEVSKIRDAFNSGEPEGYDPEVSEELFAKLFPGKQAAEILGAHHLVFVPDGVLYLLPFEMLSPQAAQGKYVLLSVPTAYFPSAASLRITRTAQRSEQWKEAFLGVGDPITSPNDPRYPLVAALSLGEHSPPPQTTAVSQNPITQVETLKTRGFEFDRIPGTAKEIQSIADLFSEKHESTDILLGVNATRKDLLDLDLSKFRYIHFATHGILPVDAGVREPSLVLSYDGTTPDQMLLPISTIMRLNIAADDVVLSACNTGSGQVTRAEGVMSLGRAFMTAGASSVTVSLWEVSDASTALLMKQYYQNLLLGKSKDKALANARTWLFMNGYKEPFYWAPFVLIGE